MCKNAHFAWPLQPIFFVKVAVGVEILFVFLLQVCMRFSAPFFRIPHLSFCTLYALSGTFITSMIQI